MRALEGSWGSFCFFSVVRGRDGGCLLFIEIFLAISEGITEAEKFEILGWDFVEVVVLGGGRWAHVGVSFGSGVGVVRARFLPRLWVVGAMVKGKERDQRKKKPKSAEEIEGAPNIAIPSFQMCQSCVARSPKTSTPRSYR